MQRPHYNIVTLILIGVIAGHVMPTVGCQSTRTIDSIEVGERLYDNFGTYHRAISTSSPEAQMWFDQGIQLLYGFNHDEAIRSFRAAAEADSNCAMAWWGIAYAAGLHINNPAMSEKQSTIAWEATQEALARIEHASAVEQALIRAVAERYTWPIPEDRAPLDQAYAAAMERAWKAYPNDPDVGALYAESLMNLQPWDLWTKDGQPKGRTLEIVATLERVMEIKPNHPGANHFYIHAVEASPTPERAVVAAERLGSLVPGSGHLVHMPSHIYIRVGRFEEAVLSNQRAVAADRAYFAVAPEPDFYSLYYVHNIHMLAYAAMMNGQSKVAIQAARELERDIPQGFLREWAFIADGFMPVVYHVLIRFGKWEEVLAEPAPPDWRYLSVASWRYARGVSFSALGKVEEAKQELASFEMAAAAIPDHWMVGNSKASDVMNVARQMLIGELAYREGRLDEAFAALRKGVEFEDQLAYDEPPDWMQPVRHALGALLMGAGRYAEAEQVYRDDLAKNNENGWALLGLSNALRAQGRTDEANLCLAKRDVLWANADVSPTSSCYCEPGQ